MRALRPRWRSLLVGAATVGIVLLFLAGSGPRGPALPSGPTPPPAGTHAVPTTVRSADAGPGRLGGAGPAPGATNRSAISSPTWGNATGAITGTPPRVTDGSLAYDPLDGYLVLFGGHDPVSGTDSSATLAFEGDQWVTLSPPTSPPARVDAALAWDPLDQYLVLFGGSGASVLSDTWTYSHDRWTELNLTNHPSGRDGAAMTWDGSDGYLLLFGGSTSAAGAFDDTWKFVGGNWTQLHPVFSPPARTSASFAFDPTANDTVLFGGDGLGPGPGRDHPLRGERRRTVRTGARRHVGLRECELDPADVRLGPSAPAGAGLGVLGSGPGRERARGGPCDPAVLHLALLPAHRHGDGLEPERRRPAHRQRLGHRPGPARPRDLAVGLRERVRVAGPLRHRPVPIAGGVRGVAHGGRRQWHRGQHQLPDLGGFRAVGHHAAQSDDRLCPAHRGGGCPRHERDAPIRLLLVLRDRDIEL